MKLVGWALLLLGIGVLGGFIVRLLWPHQPNTSSRSSVHALREQY